MHGKDSSSVYGSLRGLRSREPGRDGLWALVADGSVAEVLAVLICGLLPWVRNLRNAYARAKWSGGRAPGSG